MTRTLSRLVLVVTIVGGVLLASVAHAPGSVSKVASVPSPGERSIAAVSADAGAASTDTADGAVWVISFVRARPGQRERLERFLKANWLTLDEQALRQKHIVSYRMLRADPDPREKAWDFAVQIEYANRQAMTDFVPFYIALARERPHVRIDGLDFADLGEVVQQRTVTPLPYDDGHE